MDKIAPRKQSLLTNLKFGVDHIQAELQKLSELVSPELGGGTADRSCSVGCCCMAIILAVANFDAKDGNCAVADAAAGIAASVPERKRLKVMCLKVTLHYPALLARPGSWLAVKSPGRPAAVSAAAKISPHQDLTVKLCVHDDPGPRTKPTG